MKTFKFQLSWILCDKAGSAYDKQFFFHHYCYQYRYLPGKSASFHKESVLRKQLVGMQFGIIKFGGYSFRLTSVHEEFSHLFGQNYHGL